MVGGSCGDATPQQRPLSIMCTAKHPVHNMTGVFVKMKRRSLDGPRGPLCAGEAPTRIVHPVVLWQPESRLIIVPVQRTVEINY